MNTHLVFDELSVALHYSLQQKTKTGYYITRWLALIHEDIIDENTLKQTHTDVHAATHLHIVSTRTHTHTHTHADKHKHTRGLDTHTHAVTNLHTRTHIQTICIMQLCNYAIIHGEHAINLTNYSSKIYIVNGIYRHLVIGVRNWWRWWHILNTNIQVYMKLNYSYMFDCMFMFVQCSLHSI